MYSFIFGFLLIAQTQRKLDIIAPKNAPKSAKINLVDDDASKSGAAAAAGAAPSGVASGSVVAGHGHFPPLQNPNP